MTCLCCWTHSLYDQANPIIKRRTHALRQTRCILKLQVGLKPQQSTAYPHSVVTARTHNRFAQFYFYMLENKFRYCGQPPAACYLCIFISVVTHQTCQLLELALSYFTWQGSSWSLRRHVKNKSFCRTVPSSVTWMPANLLGLKQCCKAEWTKTPPQQCETDEVSQKTITCC